MADLKTARDDPPALGFNSTSSDEGNLTRHVSQEDKRDSLAETSIEDGQTGVVAHKSRGVWEMEMLKGRMTFKLLVVLYGFFTILSYTLSLNQFTSATYLNYAFSYSFQAHSLQATIRTITAVFQAMSQPPIAKIADVFGRLNAYILCVLLYVVGYVIVTASTSVVMYAVGNSIYILGISGLFLLQNIIISDISSTRNRVFWTFFPSIPGVINTFVAGDIAKNLFAAGDPAHQWRWGFGMFCILTPVLALPITLTLWRYSRLDQVARAEVRAEKAARPSTPFKARLLAGTKSVFWQLDFIGLFLFTIGFGLFFVTITLANSRTAKWSDAHSIAQMVVGAVLIAAFVLWERLYAPHPLLPFALLRRKTVVGCCLIALLSPMSGRITAGYLFTFLQVAADQSVLSATRITNFPSVAGTVTGICAGLAARYFRVLKPIIICGFCIQILGTGLMLRYRTSTNSQAELAVVQLIRGAANGLLPFPTQSLIQAAAPHEHLAAITAGWLVVYYMSGGIGSAIGGAIWTTTVPRDLAKNINAFSTNTTLITFGYNNPLGYAARYPVGTPERSALSNAQDKAQRQMVITGLCVSCVALLVSISLIDNLRLTDEQSLQESEDIVAKGEKKAPVGEKRRDQAQPVVQTH